MTPRTLATAVDADQELLRSTRWPSRSRSRKRLRVVDLFSGAGGMSLGALLAARELRRSFEIALSVERDPVVSAIHHHNFERFLSPAERERMSAPEVSRSIEDLLPGALDERPTHEERKLLEHCGEVDLLMGGPPCQGHSNLNNSTRRDDARNSLYERMARAAQVLQPRFLLIENVPSVVHAKGGHVDRVEEELDRLGYETRRVQVRFERLGVPQARKRHVLIGAERGSFGLSWAEQQLSNPERGRRDVRWAIADLEGADAPEGSGGFDAPPTPSPENRKRLAYFRSPEGRRAFVLPDGHRPRCHREKKHSYTAIYGRLDWDGPSNTITTGYGSMGQGRYVHPSGRRTITPHEAARLQTFPDFFSFDAVTSRRTKWAMAIGNAVPPFGMREIVKELVGQVGP